METEPAPGPDLEIWYRAHRPELVRLAALALGDAGRAEEIVHDVFAGLVRRPRHLDDPAAYLRVAVLNRCRSSFLRARTARGTVERLRRQRPATDDLDVADAAILAAVRALPRRQRDVVLLRYWLDLSEADIAAALGVSAGTVKTCAHRALATLAPQLEAHR